MDKDKLNKAAEEYNRKLGKSRNVTWNDGEYGFIAGADWLMQQPFSERLTEEEKEKLTPANRYILKQIFGADLFKEK